MMPRMSLYLWVANGKDLIEIKEYQHTNPPAKEERNRIRKDHSKAIATSPCLRQLVRDTYLAHPIESLISLCTVETSTLKLVSIYDGL